MTLSEIAWTTHSAYPLLALLQLVPLAGALLIRTAIRRDGIAIALAMIFSLAELALAIFLYKEFDAQNSAFQFAERVQIAGPMVYHAGVDGVSVLFILLTALLSLIISIYGPVRGLGPGRFFLPAVLTVEATLMSLFVTLDMLWFALMSILQLSIIGHMLWRWGTSPEKDLAVKRFFQFMSTGIVMFMISVMMVGWGHSHVTESRWTFDLLELVNSPGVGDIQSVVFFLMFYGLAVRTPLFPLHGWLPLAAEHGNIAVAPVFLLGLKVGIYGMLRFLFPLLPEAVSYWHPYVVTFAVAGIFYAALLAMLQNNMRRLLAFAVVSHTSILVIGLFSLNHIAFQGSVMLSVNFGLGISALMMMTGLVFRRTRTALLPQLGGLFDHIPLIGITFLVASLSIVGMPGTPGFDAAHLVLEGAIESFGTLVTIAAAVGNVVAAGFLLSAFQRAFLAQREQGTTSPVAPMTMMERFIALAVLGVLLGTGFYMEPWLTLIDGTLKGLGDHYHLLLDKQLKP
ncbi:MAG: NADH-quinone oxidoreductase subunit M [Gammaproteobacteria bacterium]|nr:NADH-quinone oxidoreductase subunit M [Gammaproteobacteria bacterium]